MKKIINTAPPVVVTSLHTPYSVLLTLRTVGTNATLTQAQDIAKNLWFPDRTIEPLFLVPVFSVYDTDKQEAVSAVPTLTWYVNGVVVNTSTPSESYYIITDAMADDDIPAGSLAVRKNVDYNEPVTVKCVATYGAYTADSEQLLTSENKPNVFYRVDLKNASVVEYHPLLDESSQRTFQAFVQHSQDAVVWEEVIGKSINAVDLGSLTWNLSNGVFSASLQTAAKTDGGAVLAGYTQDQTLADDKTISTSNGNIRIKDAAYSSAADFKAAMDGKVLFYELATKTVQEDFLTAMRKVTGFFWYLDGQLITKDTYGYVSGQGMETLVLDADYIDKSVISVRIAVPVFTDDGVTMPTVPSEGASAQSTLVWEWEHIDVMPIALGGSSVHRYSSQKVFNSIARVNGEDATSTQRSHIRTVWYTHDTDKPYTNKTYYGSGESVTLPASAMFRTGKVNVEVGLDLYLLGAWRETTNATTGNVSLVREETQISNTAPVAIISSSNTPLEVSLTLKVESGTLTQAQDVTKNLWIPDRNIEAMSISPVLSVYDHDAKSTVEISPVYTWFVNGVIVPSTNTPSQDYYIQNGKLWFRKNTSYLSPDVIRCSAMYADNLRLTSLTSDAELLLTTENKPEAIYTVDIEAAHSIIFHPFTEESTQRTVNAIAQYGDTILNNEVKYFWYIDGELITNEMVGYISGQGTKSITLNLDFFKDVTLSVKIGVIKYQDGEQVIPTEPNQETEAQRLITWDYENVELLPIGRGGSAMRASSGEKYFEAILRVNGKDVSNERREKYTRTRWTTHDTNADATNVVDKGWSPDLILTKEDLYRSSAVNVEVGAELYILDEFKMAVGYDSYQMVNGKLVGVGEPKMVIDDLTGKTVVMNGDDEYE